MPLRKKSQTSITSIIEEEASQLQFYPYPAINSFKLNGFEEDVQVILLNITGKVVLQTNVINNTQIDISSLSKGVYIIQANDNYNHSIYDKLIVE